MEKKQLEKLFDELFDDQMEFNFKEGSYLYHLKRCKSSFSIGTITLDDFEELVPDDEWVQEARERFKNFIFKKVIPEVLKELLSKEAIFTVNLKNDFNNHIKNKAKELYNIDL